VIEYIFLLFLYGSILSYIVLGFIFSFETLLALHKVESAKRWIRKFDSPKSFKRKLYIFYPFYYLGYFFLEVLPYHLGLDDEIKPLDFKEIYEFVYGKKEEGD